MHQISSKCSLNASAWQYIGWTSQETRVGNYSSSTPVFCLHLPGVKLESFIELVSIHKPFKALVLHSDAEYI